MKIQKHFLLIVSLSCLLTGQAHSFIELSNIDNLHNPITVYIQESLKPDDNTKGSCWKNTGEVLLKEGLVFEETIGLGKSLSNTNKICVEATVTGQKFATNPLNNVPECEIQFFRILGGKDNPGQARASLACGYTGLCMDGKDYNYNNRADKQTDGFIKNCLPYPLFPEE